MGLVAVQQGQQTVRSVITTSGTQFVEGPLVIESGVTITLHDTAFPGPGDYVLFDYSAGTFADPTQLSNLTINGAALTRASVVSASNDAINKRIILSLAGNPLNGTQYVEGPLVIEDGALVTLPAVSYAGVGTYVLFDVPGGALTATLAGGTPNYLTGLRVQPPPGRIVSDGYAFWDAVNNQVKVTLA